MDFKVALLTSTLQDIGVVMCLLTTYKATKLLQLAVFIKRKKYKRKKR